MMACSMSSAGLWPTVARRWLTRGQADLRLPVLSQDDWAPVRTFSTPITAHSPQAPFPARHTIPFQVWRRFPQAADSATDWQALLRWRRWLAWLPRRPNSITARRAAAARSSGPHHAAAGESRTRIRRLGSTGGWTVVRDRRQICLPCPFRSPARDRDCHYHHCKRPALGRRRAFGGLRPFPAAGVPE